MSWWRQIAVDLYKSPMLKQKACFSAGRIYICVCVHMYIHNYTHAYIYIIMYLCIYICTYFFPGVHGAFRATCGSWRSFSVGGFDQNKAGHVSAGARELLLGHQQTGRHAWGYAWKIDPKGNPLLGETIGNKYYMYIYKLYKYFGFLTQIQDYCNNPYETPQKWMRSEPFFRASDMLVQWWCHLLGG